MSQSEQIQGQSRAWLRRQLQALAATPDASAREYMMNALLDALAAPEYVEQPGDEQRVVVTGMGVVTPLGLQVDEFWNSLVEGRSGTGPVTQCDASGLPSTIAAEVLDFEPQRYIEAKEARRLSRAGQFAVAAARMALDDARIAVHDANRHDIGAIIANGSTSPPETEALTRAAFAYNNMRINPFYLTMALPNMPSCQVAIQLGLMGYNTTIATACAAGSQAIGEAAEVIRRGEAAVMLAGGTEAPICRMTLASFCAMRALSTRNDDPARASRPFDASRDGFVLGEGAGVLVLEQLGHARRRGARIYAEVAGYASSCDAYHVTAPHPHGAGAVMAMSRALAQARLAPHHIDYINAHATGTQIGDAVETEAIKRVFGTRAKHIPVSASKSMLGHLTSAAGAVEAVATIQALRFGVVPPTMNYAQPDPSCDLDYVPNQARPMALQAAMSNSFGFGGVNAVLVLTRAP